jgi:hypothetical protein
MVAGAPDPWRLVAPWYRWPADPSPAGSAARVERTAGRYTRPVLQKYDTAQLVNEFLKDPQRSLRFVDEDFVHQASKAIVDELPDGRKRSLAEYRYEKTERRKLFLDTHKRFYLVVCELHCDVPGFPSTSREHVCDTGFVVRRRTVPLTETQTADAARIVAMVERVENRERVMAALVPAALRTFAVRHQEVAAARVAAAQQELTIWAKAQQLSVVTQGWFPTTTEHVGAWQDVGTAGVEQVFPLYPLVPPPADLGHAGRGHTIYFGLVPTGSADVDAGGTARFDDQATYEIRCFVRRHKPQCPRKPPNCCHGELVWSDPTELYQLAAQFDLVGTSNRPVTMQLPDMDALQAQAAILSPAEIAPFRMKSPPNSSLAPQALTDKDLPRGGEICSFAIPLITIIATFVLKLFLPIVVLAANLFFLLRLKFCLPPSLSLDAKLKASLDVDLTLDTDIGFDAKVKKAAEVTFGTELGDKLSTEYAPRALAHIVAPTVADSVTPSPRLEYEAAVQWEGA